MAPTHEDTTSRDLRHDDTGNPFIAFRRFADEQMSSLLHSLLGQPQRSTATPKSAPDGDLPWIAQAMTEEQRRRLRNMRDQESQSEANSVTTEKFYQRREQGAGKSEDEIARCPYRPADQEVPERNRQGPPCDLAPRTCCDGGLLAHLHDAEIDYSAPTPWVIHYLDHSPYSPHYLETQELFRERGTKWRDAFEDLLAMQSGLPMPSEDSSRRNKCNPHWVASMVAEGLFGRDTFVPMGPVSGTPAKLERMLRRGTADARQPENDADGNAFADPKEEDDEGDCCDDDDYDDQDDDEDTTELDWYERLLCLDRGLFSGGFFRALASEAFKQESRQSDKISSAAAVGEDGKTGIISTLTTTERITLPDGSVHTKMVLKKRFADGREESTETTHTTNSHHEEKPKQIADSKPEKLRTTRGGDEGGKSKEKKSGWFWN